MIYNESISLLFTIYRSGYVEYKDPEFETIDDFKNCKGKKFLDFSGKLMTLESFKNRNCGGTYYLIKKLLDNKMIESDYDLKFNMYRISDIGNRILKNSIRKLKIKQIENYNVK